MLIAERSNRGSTEQDDQAWASRLELVYQRVLAVRADHDGTREVASAARLRITDLERELAEPERRDAQAMARIAQRLGLDARQVQFVWTALACALDGRIVPHLEALGGSHARHGLSVSLHAALEGLDGAASAELSAWLAAPNPLVSYGLLATTEDVSPAARAYAVSPPLVAYLLGFKGNIAPLRVHSVPGDLLHDQVQDDRLTEISAALTSDPGAIVVIEGPRGSGRATAAACAVGRDVVVLDLARLDAGQLAPALVALARERVLRDAMLVLANADHTISDDRPELRALIGRFIDTLSGPLIVTVAVAGIDLGTERSLVRVRWDVAGTAVRAELWHRFAHNVGVVIEGPIEDLALRYPVGPAAIRRAIQSTRMLHRCAAIDAGALASGLRHNIAERLGGLAERVEVHQTWDDLVVAEDIADQITALIGRILYAHTVLERWGYRRKIARGTGIAALFSGPPGTGKTMVAGLIARELDLELYQVDLSKVVSKWVGETEKHLAAVFEAAEDGHALLLFDEADALFGQRSTQVKGAVDRYANLEVNYLLQRIEAFGGITVLTTNLDAALDAAIKRRLASHIVFAAPSEDERARLWERQTRTGSAPLARDIDYDVLAQEFAHMTGANIRNAALAAAFLAAQEGAAQISQAHLLRAGRIEYRAMGHVFAERIAVSSRRSSRL